MRIFLPIYFTAYIAICFALRSYAVWKTTGINPITLGASDSAHDYIGRVFKMLIFLVSIPVVLFCFRPDFYAYSLPFSIFENDTLKTTGTALLLLSLAVCALAQWQMGNSWRIGIDSKNKTDLVRKGIFKYSRNPIFLSMLITLSGLFLILPNAITLFVFLLSHTVLQIQVRLQEEHLLSSHGHSYLEFKKKVRRWI